MTATAATPAWAFEAYVSVRNRLPSPGPHSVTPQVAETLADIAAPYDLILLDAYGVLNVGEQAIPGAPERMAELRRAGKRTMVVTNSAGYPKRAMMARYARLGFDFAPHEVVSSREALLRHLDRQPKRRWGLMLAQGYGLEEFEALEARFLDDAPLTYDWAEGFLLVGSEGWTEARQARLEAALRERPRPVLVGNPDIVAPREGGLSLEPGHFAHRLADATGVRPEFFGKPFRQIYDLALSRLHPSPASEKILMVGDTLHTDILGGRSMGLATALVTAFGSLAGSDVAAAIATSGITPDFVVERT
ncbi:HAD-IIA family hydrolase [Roseitranquillus sediminis]|uniref:HAD-IIA family hydrolase n=1 Tax=Roseitranquillus sediminis TaxID=2809051 RepID=UPI001D0CB4E8|nr:HAD-IIA family hydrolase [Roseitranquillus sediminis]MBM9593020.1 HAD-IIA family hydrolase [Roseitranquillus sediminis]